METEMIFLPWKPETVSCSGFNETYFIAIPGDPCQTKHYVCSCNEFSSCACGTQASIFENQSGSLLDRPP